MVNEAFVRSFFGSRNPLGQRVTFGTADEDPSWMEVVGVVGDVHHTNLTSPAAPEIYVPAQQVSTDFWTIFVPLPLSFVVRSELSSDALTPAIKAAVHDVDAEQPVSRLRPVGDSGERVGGALPVQHAAVDVLRRAGAHPRRCGGVRRDGLHGQSAHTRAGNPARTWRPSGTVRSLVLRQGLGMALLGIVLGLAGALGLTRFLTTQLFGVSPPIPS